MEIRMKVLFLNALLVIVPLIIQGQEIWNGNFIEFEKDSLADWTLEENQDRITDNVWLTRKNIRGIYNIAQENGFSHLNGSPIDTEWAFGTTAEYDQLFYEPWSSAIDSMVNLMIGEDMVIHLITDDIYIDIKVLDWGITQAGGGYMLYERATENTLSTQYSVISEISLYPNPTDNFIHLKGLTKPAQIAIFSASGELVLDEIYKRDKPIDVSGLSPGLYYVKLAKKGIVKLVII